MAVRRCECSIRCPAPRARIEGGSGVMPLRSNSASVEQRANNQTRRKPITPIPTAELDSGCPHRREGWGVYEIAEAPPRTLPSPRPSATSGSSRFHRGRSSVGRALESHSRGRRFDPDRLHFYGHNSLVFRDWEGRTNVISISLVRRIWPWRGIVGGDWSHGVGWERHTAGRGSRRSGLSVCAGWSGTWLGWSRMEDVSWRPCLAAAEIMRASVFSMDKVRR
jgi:hypothetical protein